MPHLPILLILIPLAFLALFLLLYITLKNQTGSPHPSRSHRIPFPSPSRRAGNRGEHFATEIIRSVLREGDRLFTNLEISYDGKPAEMDNVVVNRYGVFIIEVKNYVGELYGGEDDFEWSKYKTTDAGNTYGKTVKNPIKQVKRQVYILAKYLNYYGCPVWVEGRAMLIHNNSPVESPYILHNTHEIDRTIHTPSRGLLNAKTIEAICRVLS